MSNESEGNGTTINHPLAGCFLRVLPLFIGLYELAAPILASPADFTPRHLERERERRTCGLGRALGPAIHEQLARARDLMRSENTTRATIRSSGFISV